MKVRLQLVGGMGMGQDALCPGSCLLWSWGPVWASEAWVLGIKGRLMTGPICGQDLSETAAGRQGTQSHRDTWG